jgi:hypothetical protein
MICPRRTHCSRVEIGDQDIVLQLSAHLMIPQDGHGMGQNLGSGSLIKMSHLFYKMMWVTTDYSSSVLIIKPITWINFLKFYFGMKLYVFRTFSLSINRSFSLYKQQSYMSYTFVDSRIRMALMFHPDSARDLSTGSRWHWCGILILLESCLQTCMTYTIAVCTVRNSWWWTKKLSKTCRISFQNKIWEN